MWSIQWSFTITVDAAALPTKQHGGALRLGRSVHLQRTAFRVTPVAKVVVGAHAFDLICCFVCV